MTDRTEDLPPAQDDDPLGMQSPPPAASLAYPARPFSQAVEPASDPPVDPPSPAPTPARVSRPSRRRPLSPLAAWLTDTFGLRIAALVTGVADGGLIVGSVWLDKFVKMLLPHESGWGSTVMEYITTLAIVGTVAILAVHDLYQLTIRLFRPHESGKEDDDEDDE